VTKEDLTKLASSSLEDLPALWLSLTPILLPVLLIAGSTMLKFESIKNLCSPEVQSLIKTLGNKTWRWASRQWLP